MEDFNSLDAVARNVRLRNGRRAIPVELPRPFVDDALETLGHIAQAVITVAVIGCSVWGGLMVAESQYAAIDQVNQESIRHLPACATEDSDNCYWDAKARGNHRGHSFTIVNGEVRYVD